MTNSAITLLNFNPDEFKCTCGCGLNSMKPPFLWKLQQVRTEAGIPFTITSGFRCSTHNKAVGGVSTSDHVSGEGVDIAARTSKDRWKIVSAAISCGIKRIGIGKTFVHLGDNRKNPQLRMWVY